MFRVGRIVIPDLPHDVHHGAVGVGTSSYSLDKITKVTRPGL